jgi:hypothetical protein
VSLQQVIYLSLLGSTFIISLLSYKYHKSLNVLTLLFGIGVFTDTLFNTLYKITGKDYWIIYYVYIPLEYCLLSVFFYRISDNMQLKKMIIYVFPLYAIIIVWMYTSVYTLTQFPGWAYNTGGTLLIFWSIITLFLIDPIADVSILKMPLFWICTGMILFYAGIFAFNGVYDFLFTNYFSLSNTLLNGINKVCNYILYLCFIYAFICSHRLKKYVSPLQ